MEGLIKMKEENEKLKRQILVMEPKVSFLDKGLRLKNTTDLSVISKVLELDCEDGELFEVLRHKGMLLEDNTPSQSSINKGYFRVITEKCNMGDGSILVNVRNLALKKGVNYIRKMFSKKAVTTFMVLITLFTSFGQSDFSDKFADSSITLSKQMVWYDPSYVKLKYPGGDVAKDKGVCTDVVIRAYRKLGIDLQKEVHEDMAQNFSLYPKSWGRKSPDSNIDHRRVPNLMTFFSRKGVVKKISKDTADYAPGDIVCWNLGGGVTHIGIVVKEKSEDNKRYKVIHNPGVGQVVEDFLFSYKIIGHYSYEK